MYIPPSFLESDTTKLQSFIDSHSFATVVSTGDGQPMASHLPLLWDGEAGPCGGLLGHFARANSHWQMAADKPVLAIFHGPHAYVSPGWFETQNAVPTWNYVAVHAYGILRLVDDRDQLLAIVRRMVQRYEADRQPPWSVDDADSQYIDKLLGAIVGFEIAVERLEGKWKLNQNHSVERRRQIANGLRATGRHDELLVAAMMDAAIQSGG